MQPMGGGGMGMGGMNMSMGGNMGIPSPQPSYIMHQRQPMGGMSTQGQGIDENRGRKRKDVPAPSKDLISDLLAAMTSASSVHPPANPKTCVAVLKAELEARGRQFVEEILTSKQVSCRELKRIAAALPVAMPHNLHLLRYKKEVVAAMLDSPAVAAPEEDGMDTSSLAGMVGSGGLGIEEAQNGVDLEYAEQHIAVDNTSSTDGFGISVDAVGMKKSGFESASRQIRAPATGVTSAATILAPLTAQALPPPAPPVTIDAGVPLHAQFIEAARVDDAPKIGALLEREWHPSLLQHLNTALCKAASRADPRTCEVPIKGAASLWDRQVLHNALFQVTLLDLYKMSGALGRNKYFVSKQKAVAAILTVLDEP